MDESLAFQYPAKVHERRHGPQGYTTYESYRDWLRDEFAFRCVFCLRREQWDRRPAMFHIDHEEPQSVAPDRIYDYDNLLYVCSSCNSVKSDLAVPGALHGRFWRMPSGRGRRSNRGAQRNRRGHHRSVTSRRRRCHTLAENGPGKHPAGDRIR